MPMNVYVPKEAIKAKIRNKIDGMTQKIITVLQYVGETCVDVARNLPSPSLATFNSYNANAKKNAKYHIPPHQPNYIDWTKNLRSSIGFKVAVDGEVVRSSSFEALSGTATEGSRQGEALALELIKQFPEGIVLVIVAGMRYAKFVTLRGYDVLDSADLLANKLIPEMLQQLGFEPSK